MGVVGEDTEFVARVRQSTIHQATADKELSVAGERLVAARHNMRQRNMTLIRDVLRLFNTKYR